jgi:hypothetical protein
MKSSPPKRPNLTEPDGRAMASQRVGLTSTIKMRPSPHRVALLHTSGVHVATFDRLFSEFEAEVALEHYVSEDLLVEAQKVGPNDPLLVERVQHAMRQSSLGGASMVVCTCSTIGGAAERTLSDSFQAMRIDRAMADQAVGLGPNILIVAALASTLNPTRQLVKESARALAREVHIELLHIQNAWDHFLEGRQDRYIEEIVAGVSRGLGSANAVILSQASMAQAADALGGIGVKVLTSPQLGVERIMKALRNDG